MSETPRMVKLAEMWEKTSQKGTKYFSGFLGDAQILMFKAGEHPERPGITVWRLFAQERDPARRPGAARQTATTPREAAPERKPALAADDDDPLPF